MKMTHCSCCGKLMAEDAAICLNCGCASAEYEQRLWMKRMTLYRGVFTLSFVLPLIGLFLSVFYAAKQPQKAGSAEKGALYGMCLWMFVACIYVAVEKGLF